MNTYTQLVYHIIFGTKRKIPWIKVEKRKQLFGYISGILKKKGCYVYMINGTDDHIHIIAHVPPSQKISDLVKDVKLATTSMIKKENLFKRFNGWQKGYAAFSVRYQSMDRLIDYIANQEKHHKKLSFSEELILICKKNGVEIDERMI